MCCIIHRPKGAKEITSYKLKEILRINSDGWGIAYHKDNTLKVVKSLKMNDAIDQIRELEKEDIEFLFHARYATHGDKDEANCHPFELSNGLLFHNGKIDVFCRNKKMSDTYYFSLKVNKYIKKNKTLSWITNKFKKQIGPSRLAFMSDTGEITKFGEWHTVDECFYSKLNWKYGNYNVGYQGYNPYGYGGYEDEWPATKHINSIKPAEGWNYLGVDIFKECVEVCQKGDNLLQCQIKKLSERELISLAIHFPEACAKYLYRTIY